MRLAEVLRSLDDYSVSDCRVCGFATRAYGDTFCARCILLVTPEERAQFMKLWRRKYAKALDRHITKIVTRLAPLVRHAEPVVLMQDMQDVFMVAGQA